MKNVKDMKNQDFGIEIETFGISRKRVASMIAKFFGTEVQYAGTYYDIYEIKDAQNRTWKVMYDGSLPNNTLRERGGAEIVSPILYYRDIETVQKLVTLLKSKGVQVNEKCGIHIHVGAHHLNVQQLKNLANVMYSKEDIIYKALQVSENREQHYCKKTDEVFIDKLNTEKPADMQSLKNLWYSTLAPFENSNNHYNKSRYHSLNYHATFTKGTVEFRLFNGSLDADEIKAYIQFVLALVTYAENAKKTTAKKTITDNEKYAMRTWMIKLNLNGDEFETCRKVFLKNLQGNSAWR